MLIICLGIVESAQALVLKVDQGRMEASFEGVPLRKVLDAVSRETGVVVFVEESLLATQLNVRFKGLSMEEGLKKIVRGHSYVFVFSPEKDELGNHKVKAVRIYPKGKPDQANYLMLDPSDQISAESGTPPLLTLDQVEALLERNEEITRSHIARKIGENKDPRAVGNTPGQRSLVSQVLQRSKKVRDLKALKAETLARKNAYEQQRAAEFERERAREARTEFEQRRHQALKARLSNHSVY